MFNFLEQCPLDNSPFEFSTQIVVFLKNTTTERPISDAVAIGAITFLEKFESAFCSSILNPDVEMSLSIDIQWLNFSSMVI
jgi:hypothetical protein